MKEKGENIWLKNLPAHTPPEGAWEHIEAGLDNMLASERFLSQMAGLPEHKAPAGLWSRIDQNLARRRFARIGFIASGIAATLLIAFILKGLLISEQIKEPQVYSHTKIPAHSHSSVTKTGSSAKAGTPSLDSLVKQRNPMITMASPGVTILPKREKATNFVQINNAEPGKSSSTDFLPMPEFSNDVLSLKARPINLQSGGQITLNSGHADANPVSSFSPADTLTAWLLDRNAKINYPPPPIAINSNERKGVSLGVNYFPEPMSKSDYASAYQTFALMAQYQMPSMDIRMGLGISYQSSAMEYSADYKTINSGFGQNTDTLISNGDTIIGYLSGIGEINISGKERASFLNYTIGAGKRIFSSKRFSTSLRVGAGFSLLLDNQNKLNNSSFDPILNQANTYVSNTKSNIPDINQTHFDLITGFDFNYRLHKRWSLSLEPTLKYYFNPVYNGSNSRSFTTGLRTGILFKL